MGQLRQRAEGSRPSGGILQGLSRRAAACTKLQRSVAGTCHQPWTTREHRKVVELLTPVVDKASDKPYGSRRQRLAELLLELGNAHHALGEKDLALQRWREGAHGAEGEKAPIQRTEHCPSALRRQTVHGGGTAVPGPGTPISIQRKLGVRARCDCKGERAILSELHNCSKRL